MKSYDINGHHVDCDAHGYRIRFYTPAFGYIGCYFKATKKAGFSSPSIADPFLILAKGPKDAAKICLGKALARND